MERFVTLDHFEDVLRDAFAAGSEAMLIGGLAVGFWAKRFGAYDDPSEVMYSKDADLRGDRATYNLLIILLKSHGIELIGGAIVTRKEPPSMGKNYVIQVALPGIGRVSVEILEKMPLVDSPDLPPQGFAVEVEGIRVLDPLSLMIGKTHAWNHRPAGGVTMTHATCGCCARSCRCFWRRHVGAAFQRMQRSARVPWS